MKIEKIAIDQFLENYVKTHKVENKQVVKAPIF